MDAGGKIGVSTRGYGSSYDGTIEGYGDTKYQIIKDDFELESIDFVDNPSVSTTKDFVQYESKQRSKTVMKTIEELRTAYPELMKQIEEQAQSKVSEIEKTVEELKESKEEAEKLLKTVAENLKESHSDIFTVVEESKLVDEKNTIINELNEKVKELEKELSEAKEEIKKSKDEAVKIAIEAEIEKLKAEDAEFFKVKAFENCFENCLTVEEVKKVYESNKSILEAVKTETDTQEPDTVVDNKTTVKLDDFNQKRFNQINSQRMRQGLKAMTLEQYQTRYCSE